MAKLNLTTIRKNVCLSITPDLQDLIQKYLQDVPYVKFSHLCSEALLQYLTKKVKKEQSNTSNSEIAL